MFLHGLSSCRETLSISPRAHLFQNVVLVSRNEIHNALGCEIYNALGCILLLGPLPILVVH